MDKNILYEIKSIKLIDKINSLFIFWILPLILLGLKVIWDIFDLKSYKGANWTYFSYSYFVITCLI